MTGRFSRTHKSSPFDYRCDTIPYKARVSIERPQLEQGYSEGGWELQHIDFLAKYSADLNSHLLSSARNAWYLSPKIQNEFTSINCDLIRKYIVKECNTSLF